MGVWFGKRCIFLISFFCLVRWMMEEWTKIGIVSILDKNVCIFGIVFHFKPNTTHYPIVVFLTW